MKKKGLYILSILQSMLLIQTGCNDGNDWAADGSAPSLHARFLTISTNSIQFTSAGGEKTAKLESAETPWQFSSEHTNWLDIAPMSGSESVDVAFKALENNSADETRTSVVHLQSTTEDYVYDEKVSVTQSYANPYINLSTEVLTFNGASSTAVVNVSANTKWEATCDASWISVKTAPDFSSLNVIVTENASSQSRSAYIIIKGKVEKVINVTQSAASITCSVDNLHFENTGGSQLLVFNAEATWTASTNSNWISITPSSGAAGQNSITIHADAVGATNNRSGSVELKIGQKTLCTVRVEQGGDHITPATNDLTFSASASTHRVYIDANVDWKVRCEENWIQYSKLLDGINISVLENTTRLSRDGRVTLYSDGVSTSIYVRQAMANMDVNSKDTLRYGNAGGTYELTIDSETEWSTMVSEPWIQVEPDKGKAGISKVSISVVPNGSTVDRTGYADFYIGDRKMLEIPIKQQRNYLYTTDNSLQFKSIEYEQNIEVHSNISWSVLECPSWVHPSASTADGSATITFKTDDNPNIQSRSGKVKIGNLGYSLSAEIDVIQEGKYFDDILGSLSFTHKGGQYTVGIATDGYWTATSTADWLSMEPAQGQGESQMTIVAKENTTNSKRTDMVNISVGNTTRSIAVEQQGKFFSVKPEGTYTLPSVGGSHVVDVSTNEVWKATSKSPWVKVNPSSGEGDATINIHVDDNPSINSRTDTTRIEPANLQGVLVITKQAPRYLTVDTYELSFFAKGGQSDVVTIDTDAEFTISASEPWITVEQDGKTFTVKVSRSDGESQRSGKVTIEMEGLNPGESYVLEIPVIQLSRFFAIGITHMPNDTDWNTNGDEQFHATVGGYSGDGALNGADDPNFNASIDGFSSDKSWNSNGDSKFNTTIGGYSGDEDWSASGGSNFTLTMGGFAGDANWNLSDNSNFKLTIAGFASDQNWNAANKNKFTVTITGFTPDSNWNMTGSETVIVKIGQFDTDANWNAAGKGNMTTSLSGYGSDSNWNTTGKDGMNASVNPFGQDANWNSTGKGGVAATINPFGKDTNLNTNGKEATKATITPFGTDRNLNTNGKEGTNPTVNPYGDDRDLNTNGKEGTNPTVNPYGDDEDMNTNGKEGTNPTVNPYSDDEDMNTNGKEGTNPTVNPYSDDEDWNPEENSDDNTDNK